MTKTVEFAHRFDPLAGFIDIPHSGGNASYPSRLSIFGDGAGKLYERYHQNMSGVDQYPPTITPDFVEITRTRNTDWRKCVALLRKLAEQAGFAFREIVPSNPAQKTITTLRVCNGGRKTESTLGERSPLD